MSSLLLWHQSNPAAIAASKKSMSPSSYSPALMSAVEWAPTMAPLVVPTVSAASTSMSEVSLISRLGVTFSSVPAVVPVSLALLNCELMCIESQWKHHYQHVGHVDHLNFRQPMFAFNFPIPSPSEFKLLSAVNVLFMHQQVEFKPGNKLKQSTKNELYLKHRPRKTFVWFTNGVWHFHVS
jgi:hypothetical protein